MINPWMPWKMDEDRVRLLAFETIALARTWRAAALADGWRSTPIYRWEPDETACVLTKDGVEAHCYIRTEENYDAGSIDNRWPHGIVYIIRAGILGPRMMKPAPLVYDWKLIWNEHRAELAVLNPGIEALGA